MTVTKYNIWWEGFSDSIIRYDSESLLYSYLNTFYDIDYIEAFNLAVL